MVDHAKGRWNKFFQVLKTTLEFKKPLAVQAVKMMVMGFTADFIARRLSRPFDGNKPSFIDWALLCSISVAIPNPVTLSCASCNTSSAAKGRSFCSKASRISRRCSCSGGTFSMISRHSESA